MNKFTLSGGGFEVEYMSPVREVRAEVMGRPFLLQVAPDDLAQLQCQDPFIRPEDYPTTPVNETYLQDALTVFMHDLGRSPPTNVTFTRTYY